MKNSAKFIKLQLLLDAQEMETLCHHLPPFVMYTVHSLVKPEEIEVAHAQFFQDYRNYLQALQAGVIPDYRALSVAWSVSKAALHVTTFPDQRQLIKPKLPVVQLQPHNVGFSSVDNTFRSGVFGEGSVLWGIQMSYPTLFQNPQTHAIEKVDDTFPNTQLFQAIRLWVRHHTLPTPFLVGGQKVNVPIRLGKQCFAWIASHPGLQALGVGVVS